MSDAPGEEEAAVSVGWHWRWRMRLGRRMSEESAAETGVRVEDEEESVADSVMTIVVMPADSD